MPASFINREKHYIPQSVNDMTPTQTMHLAKFLKFGHTFAWVLFHEFAKSLVLLPEFSTSSVLGFGCLKPPTDFREHDVQKMQSPSPDFQRW